MKVYSVGGAVRDELLGLPVADRDYVVVGTTPEEMVLRGFKPVGKDFPVFLDPLTKAEYALARTERKAGRGYRGFTIYTSPEVTLEQDLARRDLTINAIAKDSEGRLIDPFGGERDLRAGVLRHVSPAFSEDPVRILRVARFGARFSFPVADETMALMRSMVAEGEADALVPERVWQEFARGLMEPDPVRMFTIIAECGLLEKLLPDLRLAFCGGRAANDATRVLAGALRFCAREGLSLPVRFAVMTAGLRGTPQSERQLREVVARLRAPNECRALALLAVRRAAQTKRAGRIDAAQLLAVIEASDSFRRPARMHELLRACEAESFGERGWAQIPWVPGMVLERALAAARAVAAGEIARASDPTKIAANVHRARLAAIESILSS